MSTHKEVRALMVLLPAVIGLFSLLPLGSALQLGGDEGYELQKALLCVKGYDLYTDIWNDQPPVFTYVLAAWFRAFGASILTARILAAAFGLLLCAAFYQLIVLRAGTWAGIVGVFLLLSSPAVLQLSVSVMLEVPAFALALLSVGLLFRWVNTKRTPLLVCSGAVLALALQTKLTAILVCPAILLEILIIYLPLGSEAARRLLLRALVIWGGSCLAVVVGVGIISGPEMFRSAYLSHFTYHAVPGLSSPHEHRFDPALLWAHKEVVAAALFAVILKLRDGRWSEIRFPIFFLCTAATVHALHRPWWTYYYLHLALPLSWLGAIGVQQAIAKAITLYPGRAAGLKVRPGWGWLASVLGAALAIGLAEARLEGAVRTLRASPRATADPILSRMQHHANTTKWAYAQPVIYPFHAGITVPPELAVVMLKRFWSGEIDTARIIETCQRYRPEQILLFDARTGSEWLRFLGERYKPVVRRGGMTLYVLTSD